MPTDDLTGNASDTSNMSNHDTPVGGERGAASVIGAAPSVPAQGLDALHAEPQTAAQPVTQRSGGSAPFDFGRALQQLFSPGSARVARPSVVPGEGVEASPGSMAAAVNAANTTAGDADIAVGNGDGPGGVEAGSEGLGVVSAGSEMASEVAEVTPAAGYDEPRPITEVDLAALRHTLHGMARMQEANGAEQAVRNEVLQNLVIRLQADVDGSLERQREERQREEERSAALKEEFEAAAALSVARAEALQRAAEETPSCGVG